MSLDVSLDVSVGSIIVLPGYLRFWIILDVTKEQIERGTNAEKPGLYAFSGMWYGDDPLNIGSFGKILPLNGGYIVSHISNYPDKLMKSVFD